MLNHSSAAREVLPPLLSAQDMEMARAAQRLLMDAVGHSQAAVIRLTTETGEQPAINVPPASLRFIGQLLGAMSEGRALAFAPTKQELSTVEAAQFLSVSRPFVIKEIDAGRLPHRMVGTHRRVDLDDLMAYARKMRENQAGALDRMAENARELGLDY
jgi:excisionase family DNA binding protein